MEPEEYRERGERQASLALFPAATSAGTAAGREMVDYICQYLSTVRERRVTPDVQPGYLRAQLPESAPEDP
ncbi:hypothetical protein H8959_016149 [Pygathrix nigripes]